jgi:hypothetical protein
VITLRYNSRLHHVGLGRKLAGTRVLVLVAGLDVRVLNEDGELLRQLTLDPSLDYQRQRPWTGSDVPRQVCTMSRDITVPPWQESNLGHRV